MITEKIKAKFLKRFPLIPTLQNGPEENQKKSECWIWTGAKTSDGYGMLMVTDIENGVRKVMKAHRLSWEAHRGPIPEGLCVLHRCDTPACFNPDHLFIGTHSENMQDMYSKKRRKKWLSGENHPRARLTEKMVGEIRERHTSGETLMTLASEYSVSYKTAWAITRGRRWNVNNR